MWGRGDGEKGGGENMYSGGGGSWECAVEGEGRCGVALGRSVCVGVMCAGGRVCVLRRLCLLSTGCVM